MATQVLPIMWVLLVAYLAVCTGIQAIQCPSVCICKWKNGKKTVECNNKGLMLMPEHINADTQVLDLSGNNLQSLPNDTFQNANLLNIQKLYLGNSNIGQIGRFAFRGLTNLVELDLSRNVLASIPSDPFQEIPYLRYLDLNNNPITKVGPFAFKPLGSLVKLSLRGCEISSISAKGFLGMNFMETLDIADNKLETISEDAVLAIQELHNVVLHLNPWDCTCDLRPLKDWLQEYNIPYPVPPKCAKPPRIAGKTLEELDVKEFACRPQIIPASRYMKASSGHNATIPCIVNGVPEATVLWYHGTIPILNLTTINSHRIYIKESGVERKTSTLVINGAQEMDSGIFRCVAKNAAGKDEANFTLSVSLPLTNIANLNETQIASISVALILLIVAILVVIFVLLLRIRAPSVTKTPHPGHVEAVEEDRVTVKGPNTTQKPPRVNEIAYTTNSFNGSGSVIAVDDTRNFNGVPPTKNPDVINDVERAAETQTLSPETRLKIEKRRKRKKGKEDDTPQANGSVPNGHAVGSSEMILTESGDYIRAQTDSLYPSSVLSDSGSNFSEPRLGPDSQETLAGEESATDQQQQAIPTATSPSKWNGEGPPAGEFDPTEFGYPPDYGLPIPGATSEAHNSQEKLNSSYGSKPNLSQGSILTSTTSIATSEEDSIDTTSQTPNKALKSWQKGVPVLPPLPAGTVPKSSLKSPDKKSGITAATDV